MHPFFLMQEKSKMEIDPTQVQHYDDKYTPQ